MGSLEEEILLKMVNDFIELGSSSSPTNDTNTTTVTSDQDDHTKFYVLQEIVESRNGVESRVVGSVLKHMKDKMKCEKTCGLKKWLVKRLITDGFNASLCHSSWPTTFICPGGAYEYIDIVIEAKHKEPPIRVIIDIDFKSQFEVARPTLSYKRMLQMVPHIFVGDEDKLSHIVSILCSEAKYSFTQNGLHIPPWRTSTYILSKWLPKFIISKWQWDHNNNDTMMLKLTHGGSAQFSPLNTQSCC